MQPPVPRKKSAGRTPRGVAIIYIVRRARPGVFYNLPHDAITIGDRSISRRVHAPRIASASRLLIHGCTTNVRDAGMSTDTRTRVTNPHTHTEHTRARSAARMRARVSRAYIHRRFRVAMLMRERLDR